MVTDHDKAYTEIQESLDKITQALDKDIAVLKNVINNKETEIIHYKEQLENATHEMEGNRQLINKLLGDLSKLQNDVEWYKRTYEQRSFLGTLREKIFKRKY